MKMMDINEENNCCIEAVTPAKKKKMKQATLAFQSQSPQQLSSDKQSKKRKLTSPSVENKIGKAIKIPKKTSVSDIENKSLCNLELIDVECSKENTTLNKVEHQVEQESLEQGSPSQKEIQKLDKLKSGPLAKFFQKSQDQDQQVDNVQEINQKPVEESENICNKKNDDIQITEEVSQPQGNVNDKKDDQSTVANNSSCQTDSDIELLSSENEDKDEEDKAMTITEQGDPQVLRTPKMGTLKQKKLTPKQKERRLLSAKKREERQRMKMEKEKKLEEERQNRQKEKEEKRREKEERDKAEKEQRMLEKKMREQKKQMEIEQRQKEKQAKEEERKKREEAKEEERRKKEEEKLEAERKKQKAASNFTSFFVAKKQERSAEEESASKATNFMPFEVKTDMKIAPVYRRALDEEEKLLLEEKCRACDTQVSHLYINELKNNKFIPRKSTKTWPLESRDDIFIDDENDDNANIVSQTIVIEKHRPKLLQFSENQRPPFWGTWRKTSSHVKPRRPFSKDMQWFNYEIDSDEEWEEEEPGESLHGSEDEKEGENPEENEYDVDNEFMVPHGYLSDEEVRADEEEKEDMSPETQKVKLKFLGEQFESERNAKTSKLKPKMIGCIWRDSTNNYPSTVPQKALDFLSEHEAWVNQIPVILPAFRESFETAGDECPPPSSTKSESRIPDEAVSDLIRLLHGNIYGVRFLLKEFTAYWMKKNKTNGNHISKAKLMRKVHEIGKWQQCPEEGPMYLKACWYVPEEIRNKYVSEDLSLPNKWSYILTRKNKTRNNSELPERLEKEEKGKEKKSVPLITQFTKKITQNDLKKQMTIKHDRSVDKSDILKAPKRATLISVPRGEQFPKSTKENLLKNFVSTGKKADNESNRENGETEKTGDCATKESSDRDEVEVLETVFENIKDKKKMEADP